ncbi:hypothetical protein HBE99_00835 [Mycobacteroides chelonae]|uniref:hypothetical protein n=1 Tax=Mycobacteroides chelonae TaxID=1774 RepID=UPI001910313B|nr:hypothetical protein [Mycobacteroides chelonae]QQG95595.1 hypothetical protein HBE99_00835 [Mycobacteroides chelonae]
MFSAALPADPAPHTSQWAIEILDELRIALLECVLVLAVLPEETGLSFGALSEDLDAAHRHAKEAHHAASLLRQESTPSSPEGRRHPHTVLLEYRQGIASVVAAPSLIEHIERRVWEGVTDSHVHAEPGRCAARMERGSRLCGARTLYRDAESFGVHCYRHASEDERRRDQLVEAHLHESIQALAVGYKQAFGREVAAAWLRRRQQSPRWFDRAQLTPQTGAS